MATISGKDGKVVIGGTDVAEVTSWTLTTTSSNAAYASSSTGGWKTRLAGVKDGSGTIAGKLDTTSGAGGAITEDFDEGDGVSLSLYVDGSLTYVVPAIIDDLRVEVDVDNGDIVGWVANFSVTGPITKPSYV